MKVKLFLVFYSAVVINGAYFIPAPFLGQEFTKRGIDESNVAFIIGLTSLPALFLNPFVFHITGYFGRKRAYLLCALLMLLSYLMSVLAAFVRHNGYFQLIVTASRLLLGTGGVFNHTIAVAIFLSEHPEAVALAY